MSSFFGELVKIAATQQRGSGPWAPQTVGAPRTKLTSTQFAKAPTAPGNLGPKIVKPAAQFGKRQNYSQPNTAAPPTGSPGQGEAARQTQPPNVVFGVR